jgi:hypothetical protein
MRISCASSVPASRLPTSHATARLKCGSDVLPSITSSVITDICGSMNTNIRIVAVPRWTGPQLQRMGIRLKLNHPPSTVPMEVKEARARAIWKEQPEITAQQLMAIVESDHALGKDYAYKLLKAYRLATAKRSSVHRKMRWRIDCRTPTRIRISQILKRHPKVSAAQVIEELGPGPFRRLHWIRQVIEECRRGRPFKRKVDRF